MITIRNDTDEDYVIRFHVDWNAPGCRVLTTPAERTLQRQETVTLLGYEPGVSFTLHPALNPDLPRSAL